jgi:hypothetical protein
MTDPKLTEAEISVTETREGTPFVISDVKKDLSFFLKSEHALPKITVDYLLAQFEQMAKRHESMNLTAVLEEVVESIRQKRGDHSPAYLGIRAFARNLGAEVRASLLPGQLPAAAPQQESPAGEEGVAPTTLNVAERVQAIFKEEASSAVRVNPDVMNMGIEETIRYFFPSIGSLLLQTVRMKLVQGPTQEETGDPYWHVKFFTDLVTRFPNLKEDLEKIQTTVESMAGLLLARGQKEASMADIARSGRRGQMATVPGIHVSELQLYLEKERVIANTRKSSRPPKPEETVAEPVAGEQPGNDAKAEQSPTASTAQPETDDTHSRITSTPPEPDAHSRETVTNEAGSEAALPAAPADPKAVRAEMETVVPDEEIVGGAGTSEKDEGKKPTGIRKALRKIFG